MPLTCPKCGTDNTADSRYCRSCATPLPGGTAAETIEETRLSPADDLSPGSTFAGRYQIIEDLGRGGMGRVVKALDTRTNEKIAIKIIRADIASDRGYVERFTHELTAARRISHPNICRMYDLGEDAGRLFITMEYVAGEDLRSVLQMMGTMSPTQAIGIAIQICAGLEEAHRLHVVHRDLKPGNILVSRDGTARIMDFGIARSRSSKGMTGVGTMVGTPEYMSPEQVEGREVDGRSDIYSLGVMLFELTTGRLPFEGDTPLAVALKHTTERPPDPRSLQPATPAALSAIILRCLEKDRNRRYAGAGELRGDLESAAARLPAGPRLLVRKPTTSREITVRLTGRRVAMLAGAVALVAVTAALLVAPRLTAPRRAEPAAKTIPGSVAVVAFENQTGDAKYDYLRKVIPNLLITNLDSSGLFQVATWERMRDLLSQTGRRDVELLDANAGFDYCRREGIAFLVVGSYTRAGETFVTECKLLDAGSRRMVKSANARGAGESSILDVQVDDISRKIASGIGSAGGRIQAAHLGITGVTTRSLEAYNAYLQGQEERRKFDDTAARAAFEKAVQLDPEFAVAYLGLGESTLRSGERDRAVDAFRKAQALADRATEKEQLLIGARYAQYVERNGAKRQALLQELVAKYPREKDFRLALGDALLGSDPDGALAQYRAALDLDPKFGIAMNQAAFALVAKGDLAGAQRWLQRYVAAAPTEFNPRDSLGHVLLLRGLLDEARKNFETALSINPRVGEEIALAYVCALREDYDSAIMWLDQYPAALTDGRRAEAPTWKGILFYLLGRRRNALEELERGLALTRAVGDRTREGSILVARGFLLAETGDVSRAREDFRKLRELASLPSPMAEAAQMLSRLALAYMDMWSGDLEAARGALDEMERLLPAASRSPSRAARFRAAEIALSLGRRDDEGAIRLAKEPQIFEVLPDLNLGLSFLVAYNMPPSLDGVAQALARRGDLARALDQYRLLMTIGPETNNRRLVNPVYHLRVARIYEQTGDRARAAEHYQTFLRLWKDADPGLPEPAEARKRLAALR